MGQVLRVGVVVLPLVMFLAIFGNDIVEYFQGTAGGATEAGTTLEETAGESGFGN
ncbi:hypothetical protein [Palleronia caenipelagi]|uniref:hypothetical protein n=1 Tax=Palleronia caenipelagi TaxID=2489174 RepID=UPI00163DE1D2|nr:hypothetical protein [Palleronia caenipelagi]